MSICLLPCDIVIGVGCWCFYALASVISVDHNKTHYDGNALKCCIVASISVRMS